MGNQSLQIKVTPNNDEIHDDILATDVFVSRNGYQWTGFTIRGLSEILSLREALGRRIIEIEDMIMARDAALWGVKAK